MKACKLGSARQRRRGRTGAGGRRRRRRRTRSSCSACSATAPAPTQTVGVFLCPGYHDYIALVNSKGGIEGYKIRVLEIDNEYKVPPAMEAHERFKKEGAVLEGIYGTPQTAALTKKLEEDKILGTSPGFGTAAAADGKRYPYVFPIAASYWSQGAAAVAFAKKQLGGSLKGKKIAYLFYDNPAGKEPLVILEDLAKSEGLRAPDLRGAGARRRDGRAGARHHRPLQARLRHHAPVRPLAVGLHQGAQGQGLSAEQGGRASCGASSEADIKAAGGYERCRGLPHHPVRRRRRRLPGDQGHQRDVPGAGQARCRRSRRSACSTIAAS